MACTYYKNEKTKYSPEEIALVQSLHEEVNDYLMENGEFRTYKGETYVFKNNQQKINKAVSAIRYVNSYYGRGNTIAKVNNDRKLNVDVRPVADQYVHEYHAKKRVEDDAIEANVILNDEGDVVAPDDFYFSLEPTDFAKNDKIKRVLLPILDSMGITVDKLENYKKSYKERTGKDFPYDAVGIADMTNKIIAISEEKEDAFTLAEEFLHFTIEAMSDDFRVQRGIDLILNNESIRDSKLFAKYMRKYNNNEQKVAKEILGQIGSRRVADVINNNSLLNRLARLLNYLWNKVASLFSANAELNNIVNDIVKKSLRGDTENVQVFPNEHYFSFGSVREYVSKAIKNPKLRYGKEDIAEDLIKPIYDNNGLLVGYEYEGMMKHLEEMYDKIKHRSLRLHREGKSFSKKELKDKLNTLRYWLENGQGTRAMLETLLYAEKDLEKAVQRYKNLKSNAVVREPVEMAKAIREIAETVEMYKPLIQSIQDHLSEIDAPELPKGYIEKILKDTLDYDLYEDGDKKIDFKKLQDRARDLTIQMANQLSQVVSRLEGQTQKASKLTFASYAYKNISNNPEIESLNDVIDMLDRGADVSFFRRWFMGMSESRNDVLAGLHNAISKLKTKDRLAMQGEVGRLNEITDRLRKAGVTDFTFIFEKDSEGNFTGNIISDRNIEEYEKALNEFAEKINARYFLPEEKSKRELILNNFVSKAFQEWLEDNKNEALVKDLVEKAENRYSDKLDQTNFISEALRKRYNKEWADWFQDNTETHPDHVNMLEKGVESFFNKIPKDEQSDSIKNFFMTSLFPDHASLFRNKYKASKLTKDNLTINQQEAFNLAEEFVNNNRGFSQYLFQMGGTGYYHKGSMIRPSKKYKNDAYDSMMQNKDKREYYNYYMEMKRKYDSMLPPEVRSEYRLPQVRKDVMERFLLSGDFKAAVKETYDDTFKIREDDEDYGNATDVTALDENYSRIRTVPIHFIKKLDKMSDLSTDATHSLRLYMTMARNYKTMSDHVDILELGYDVLANRKITGKSSSLANTFTSPKEVIRYGGKTADLYRDTIDMLLYGESKKEEIVRIAGKEFNWGKIADAINKYTSLTGLGFNLNAALTNPTVASMLQIQEGIAKEFVNGKDLIQAERDFWKYYPGYMADVGKLTSENKLRHFTVLMDSMQNWSEFVHDNKTNRNRMLRMMDGSLAYSMMQSGELYVTNRVAIAMANKLELTLDGKPVKLFPNGFDIVNNAPVLKEGLKKKDGSDFTEDDLVDLRLKVASVNQRLNGVYNDLDRGMIKRTGIGRMLMVFRSWMPASINRRFGKRYFDYRTDSFTEGSYRSFGKFILAPLIKDFSISNINYIKRFKELSDMEKANVRRTFTEVAMMVALGVMASIFTSMSDDDEDNYWLALAAVQANRAYTELRFYSDPNEFLNILQNPAAGVRNLQILFRLQDSFNLFDYVTGEDDFLRRYKGGRHKGEIYLTRNMLKLVPFIEQFERAVHPEEVLTFYK